MMSERSQVQIDSRSPVGKAMILQSLSVVPLLATYTIPIHVVESHILGIIFRGSLIALAVFQGLAVRAVLQREDYGLGISLGISILALLVSIAAGFYAIIVYSNHFLGIYLIIVGMVNTMLLTLLSELKKAQ